MCTDCDKLHSMTSTSHTIISLSQKGIPFQFQLKFTTTLYPYRRKFLMCIRKQSLSPKRIRHKRNTERRRRRKKVTSIRRRRVTQLYTRRECDPLSLVRAQFRFLWGRARISAISLFSRASALRVKVVLHDFGQFSLCEISRESRRKSHCSVENRIHFVTYNKADLILLYARSS